MKTEEKTLEAHYERYRRCMVHVSVESTDGKFHSGTAFHVGDGWLITAAHNLEDKRLDALTVNTRIPAPIEAKRIMYSSGNTDLALIETDLEMGQHIEIGGYLDDWLDDAVFPLWRVLLMGYPPIPTSRGPVLVVTAGEVNAVVDQYLGVRHPFFIISCLPRGGFSGSPVITYLGDVIGVVTASFLRSPDLPHELGFNAAIGVEAVWNLLHEHGVYPGDNGLFLRAVYDGDEAASEELIGQATSDPRETSPEPES